MARSLQLVWFRQDLRLKDNPALYHAAGKGSFLPVYILDEANTGGTDTGEAGGWWLHHSLCSLSRSLDDKLLCYRGDPEEILTEICREKNIREVYWNRCYTPQQLKRDQKIKQALLSAGIRVNTYNGSLLKEPWECLKSDRTPYLVYTPYYRKFYESPLEAPAPPLPAPSNMEIPPKNNNGISLDELSLLPDQKWYTPFRKKWTPGEEGANKRLLNFIQKDLYRYEGKRDFPGEEGTTRLSPSLHFGEISARIIWEELNRAVSDENVFSLKRELVWREFSYYQLFHFPFLPQENLKKKFDSFPWQENPEDLKRWQTGQTGYPLVDAGMRELWRTGFMHNRVRMITASFLVKNLQIHWKYGARWFRDCLLDADLASNSASWQWVAGSGLDAAPYFRIFNPVAQARKFDPEGTYIRRFIPELASLPNPYLFAPWTAPDDILNKAGIQLGLNYPYPVVDLKETREAALRSYKSLPASP